MKIKNFQLFMRTSHRYLGFFMAGIMLIYALSGMLLVFRDTDFLKYDAQITKNIGTHLDKDGLGKALKIKGFEVQKVEGDQIFFKDGSYNVTTGQAAYSVKQYPMLIDKMLNFHKAPSKGSFGGVNALFGGTLLLFVLTSLLMYKPNNPIFRKGLLVIGVGALVALIMLMIV